MMSQSRVIRVLAKKDLGKVFFGWEFYLTVGVVYAICSFLIRSVFGAMEEGGIRVASDPLAFPYLVAVLLPMVYISISAVVSVVRERGDGTLQVLFHGPVGYGGYLAGKFISELATYAAVAGFILLYFLYMSLTTNLSLSVEFVQVLGASFLFAACMISLGLFVSSITAGIMRAILLFAVIVLGFSGTELLHRLFVDLSLVTGSASLGYARESMAVVLQIVRWVSPVFYFLRSYDAAHVHSTGIYSWYMAASGVYAGIVLVVCRFALQWRGVLAKE